MELILRAMVCMESERDEETGELRAIRPAWSVRAAVPARLSCHYRHPFDVPCHGYQRPLASHRCQATQQELPETHHRLDDAEHRLHRLLAQAIEFASLECFEPLLHPVHKTGTLSHSR